MINKRIYLFIFIFLYVSSIHASGILDSGKSAIHEISGKVRLVGNEPFSQLVITDATGKDYIFHKDYHSIFYNYMHTEITVSSKIKMEKLESADGKYTIMRYYLVNPTLLKGNNQQ